MKIHMFVANRHVLLERPNNGEMDFDIVERLLDKSEYDSTLFSLEKSVPVCSPRSEFAKDEVVFRRLWQAARYCGREGRAHGRSLKTYCGMTISHSAHLRERLKSEIWRPLRKWFLKAGALRFCLKLRQEKRWKAEVFALPTFPVFLNSVNSAKRPSNRTLARPEASHDSLYEVPGESSGFLT